MVVGQAGGGISPVDRGSMNWAADISPVKFRDPRSTGEI